MMDYPPPRGRDSEPPMSGLQLAELLLERGANPNSQLKQWRPPFVRLARGQDNTLATGATPLLRAAHASDLAAVKLLLEHGALVDLPNASGITPLMAAAGVGVSQNTSRAKKKTEADLHRGGASTDRGRSRREPSHTRPAQDSHGSNGPRGHVWIHLPDGLRLRVPSAERQDGVARRGAERLEPDGSFSSGERRRGAAGGREGRTPRDMAMGNYELAITEPRRIR